MVKTIHLSANGWKEQTDLISGGFSPESYETMNGGKTFYELYPMEHKMLISGDRYYSYSVVYFSKPDGHLIPRVKAQAKDVEQVYGETLVSRSNGESIIEKVSDLF